MIQTVDAILGLLTAGDELLIVDQTPHHLESTRNRLEELSANGSIRWIRSHRPSIPESMNFGAREARGDLLLYLDDDIIPDAGLPAAHVRAHARVNLALVAGRVFQPWHMDHHRMDAFTGDLAEYKQHFMGGNFSIRRDLLLQIGGFDENFKGAAYNYEREFADRLLQAGYRIWYEPQAMIRHLHHDTGGTRSKGDHLTSWNPRHPVGAYYYLFVSPRIRGRFIVALRRLGRSILTRHHLRKPWYIPVTLTSELLGLGWALWLRLKGPSLPFASEPQTERTA